MTDILKNFTGKCELDAIALLDDGADIGRGEISGVAMHFDVPNNNGFAVETGALDIPASVPMLWTHEDADVVGQWTEIETVAGALQVRGRLNLKVARAREAHALLKAGDCTGLSVGLAVDRREYWKRQGDTWLLLRARLVEVSLVAIPADTNARVHTVASLQSVRQFEKFLREAGFPKAAAIKLASGGWPRLSGNQTIPETDISDLAKRVRAAAAEIKR